MRFLKRPSRRSSRNSRTNRQNTKGEMQSLFAVAQPRSQHNLVFTAVSDQPLFSQKYYAIHCETKRIQSHLPEERSISETLAGKQQTEISCSVSNIAIQLTCCPAVYILTLNYCAFQLNKERLS